MASSDDPLYPIAILIDELKNEDVTLRLNSIRRLSTIAVALDTERTRTELIPFLLDSLEDDDEVLLALAEELGRFVPYVGGPAYAFVLLEPLGLLASVEESAVRDKACESLKAVAQTMTQQDVRAHVLPMIQRLAQGDWHAARSSAAQLIPQLLTMLNPKTGAERDAVLQMYASLCQDTTPMVRRAACSTMGVLASNLNDRSVAQQHLIPLFVRLARDEQDSVRLLVVDAALSFAKLFLNTSNGTSGSVPSSGNFSGASASNSVISVVKSCAADSAWRVRYVVADKFAELATSFPLDTFRAEILPYFVRLLRDSEAEVRTAAAHRSADVFAALAPSDTTLAQTYFVKDVLPAVRDLVTDPSQHVRAALAGSIPGIAPVLGKAMSLEHLFPLILSLLRDEFHEVRLNLLSRLEALHAVVGMDVLAHSLLPAVVDLAEDKQWRVRLATVEQMPLLAQQLGRTFFDEKLLSLLLKCMSDVVFSVREASVEACVAIASKWFGAEWAHAVLVPRVTELLSGHSNYLHRMTVLFLLRALAPVLGQKNMLANETVAGSSGKVVLQLLTDKLARDPVPNVRFNVAKTLGALVEKGQLSSSQIQGKVRPCLEKLRSDADQDVQFYAEQALQQCS